MPRLRKPPAAAAEEELLLEDHTEPTEDIVIELPDDDAGSTVVDLAEPDKVEVRTDPPGDDALKRALEATQRAEELARAATRERDEAIRRTAERDEELVRERGDREDAEYNSVLTSIAAEQATLDKAQADYEAAAGSGDWATASKANREIAIASSRLDRLEEGKRAFDTKKEATKTVPSSQQRSAPSATLDFDQKVTALGVPDNAKTWLRAHPEFVNDTTKNEHLNAAHGYLTKAKGLQPFSQAYFDALDTEFGFKKEPPAAPAPTTQQQPQKRSMPVTAPVSRDVPTTDGQRQTSSNPMTLTAEERRVARTSFTDPTGKMTNAQKEFQYAQNKAKLAKMRANGQYPQSERN